MWKYNVNTDRIETVSARNWNFRRARILTTIETRICRQKNGEKKHKCILHAIRWQMQVCNSETKTFPCDIPAYTGPFGHCKQCIWMCDGLLWLKMGWDARSWLRTFGFTKDGLKLKLSHYTPRRRLVERRYSSRSLEQVWISQESFCPLVKWTQLTAS
jgi:hypothetical protein